MATDARVFTCEFVAGSDHCPHSDQQLFRSAYQRTNRTQRTKIVRCFPHCCPRHVPRSYCGSPMQLRVTARSTGDDDDDAGLAMSDIQVFSRFRPTDTEAFSAGTRIAASTIKANIQSERSTTAEWIVSRVIRAPFQGYDAWLFELNPNGRWFYAWDSGATKARRQMRHLLETVVVIPCEGGNWFDIVATVCSPSFTFVSFRRAADAETGDSDPSVLYRELSLQLQKQQYLPPSSNRQLDDPPRQTRVRPLDDAPGTGVDSWNATSGDESFSFSPPKKQRSSPHEPPGQQTDVSAFLSSIIGFVDQLSASQLPLELVHHGILSKSDDDFRRRRRSSKTSLISGVDAVDAAIRLVWRLRMSRRVALVSAQYSSWAVNALLDQEALRLAYWQWMQVVSRHIERILEEYGWSMDDLSRALGVMNGGPVETPSHVQSHEYDWGSFVANVRQHFVFQHHNGRMTKAAQLTVFKSEWSCSLDQVELKLLDDSTHQNHSHRQPLHQLSAGCVFFFWTQLSRLSIDTSQLLQTGHLHIKSTLHRHLLSQPLRLVLDGTFRQFDTLPHGESTLGRRLPDGFMSGDYSGYICPHSGRVHVTTLVWPTRYSVDVSAYRWHWTIDLDHGNRSLELSIRVDRGSLVPMSVHIPLETLSIHDKLTRVKSWKPFARAFLPYTTDRRYEAS